MGIRLVVREAWSRQARTEISYPFEQERIVIGRGAGADVRLPHLTVSETHAIVELRENHYVITDNGSTNGTKVNGSRISPHRPKALREGDRVQVAAYVLSVQTTAIAGESVSQERTSALARRLVRESLDPAAPKLPPPTLVVVDGPQAGTRLELLPPPSRMLVGRAGHCQLALCDPEVLPEHLELVRDLDGVLARDPKTTPSALGGFARAERRLRSGDRLLLGATTLCFEEPAEESIKALAGQPDQLLPDSLPGGQPPASIPGETPEPAQNVEKERRAPRQPRKGASAPSAQPSADLIIYVLAAIILASSMAGLLFLLQADG